MSKVIRGLVRGGHLGDINIKKGQRVCEVVEVESPDDWDGHLDIA